MIKKTLGNFLFLKKAVKVWTHAAKRKNVTSQVMSCCVLRHLIAANRTVDVMVILSKTLFN